MGKKLFIFLVIFLMSLFLGLKNIKAVEPPRIIINEVLANAPNDDLTNREITNLEWFEILNVSNSDINLKDAQIEVSNSTKVTSSFKITNDLILQSNKFLLIVKDIVLMQNYYKLDNTNNFYVGSFSLVNSGGKVSISGGDFVTNELVWSQDVGDNISMEIIGPPYDSNFLEKLPCLNSGPTPGSKNSVSQIISPPKPNLLLPVNKSKYFLGDEIKFDWGKEPENDYELLLSKNSNMSNHFHLEDIDSFALGNYFWQIIASNILYQTESDIYSFSVNEPVYSDDIIINELYPDPSSGEEWVELYNNSAEDVNLKYWFLEDLKGSIHYYIVDRDLIIPAFGYLIITKSQSGITLNNDQDGIRLIRPDGKILFETLIFSEGKKGWSFARTSSGIWAWTTTLTAGLPNIFTSFIEEDEKIAAAIIKEINTVPIEIMTGDYADYENKLVKVTGKVTSTSGNTFYLDDGSGEVKIYIQEKTGIDKPEMHKNDIFEVTGIVDLYGKTWRILPQNQDDIKLIEKAAVVSATVKASTTKKASAASTISKAITPSLKSAKAAETSRPETEVKSESIKSPFWIQLTKAVLGLMAILLILLIVKVLRSPKPITIGGHFGDDET